MKRGVEDPQALSGLIRISQGLRLGRSAALLPSSFDFISSLSLNPRADHPSDNCTSTAEREAAFYCWNNFSTVQIAGLVQQATID